MSPKVIIIGSGITGALSAFGIKCSFPSASVIILDKARGVAGRMTTVRSGLNNKADLGAQYISASQETHEKYSREYQLLFDSGTLKPLGAKVDGMKDSLQPITHYVAPAGMGSVVKCFLEKTQATILLNRLVKSIKKVGNEYQVHTNDGKFETCEILISTIPIPQFLALEQVSDELSSDIQENLLKVEYTSRFVLIWFFAKGTKLPSLDWDVKYLNGGIFRYVAVDNLKRNATTEAPSVVFHTSVDFGNQNKTLTKEDVEQQLAGAAKELFPDWPAPESTKCHKWLYSQVKEAYPDNTGCLLVNSNPTLILAGDAFTFSNLNGCIESARAAVTVASGSMTSM